MRRGNANIIKQFDKPAYNQRAVLRAFQTAGWPVWVPNPVEPDGFMDNGQRLADAVYHLNKQRPKRIVFFRAGAGKVVRWAFVKRKSCGKRRK